MIFFDIKYKIFMKNNYIAPKNKLSEKRCFKSL